ncbi:MAG: hypothetical protein HWE22_05405 [Flavobacteriales bacterium]|nr:hypothetical protein [Flavobacteriales bacterium]
MIENIRFQKDEEYIEVKDGKYFVNINMSTQETEENILIDLPSLDIHSYASRKDKIQQEIHDACLSFIHHWIKQKGEDAFVKHMKSLGFEKKSIAAAIEPTVFATRESTPVSTGSDKKVKKYSEEFELA